jgi:hypothetical protein
MIGLVICIAASCGADKDVQMQCASEDMCSQLSLADWRVH